MAAGAVLYEKRQDVAVVTLNRPEVLNAFTPAMLGELSGALGRAGDEGCRALVLTGAGRGFSAGQDLDSIKDDYQRGGPDFVALLRDGFHPVVRRLREAPMPVLAAVIGVAAGAGLSLALACDTRIAAENARFTTAFTRIGLVPDSGMAYTLPRLVGMARASQLIAAAAPIDAATALQYGLVDRVVPAEKLMEEALAQAESLARGPTRAFVLSRRLLDFAQEHSLEETLVLEAQLQAEAGATADHRNAVAAFLRKEQASFEGR